MNINPKDKIAGFPAVAIRDLLHKVLDFHFYLDVFENQLKISKPHAKELAKQLLIEGYLQIGIPSGKHKSSFQVAPKGRKLALASAARPYSRPTVEKHLRDFIVRVHQTNENKEFLYRVKKVTLFGSFLSNATVLSDLDIAIELERKVIGDAYIEKNQENVRKAKENGKFFYSFLDELGFSENEVIRFLKNKSRVISLHINDDVLAFTKTQVIFET